MINKNVYKVLKKKKVLILVHFVFHDKICDDCKTCLQVPQLMSVVI